MRGAASDRFDRAIDSGSSGGYVGVVLHVVVMMAAVVAALALLLFTLGRIGADQERELRAVAARRGWAMPDPFSWDGATVAACIGDVDVALTIRQHGVVASTALSGERALMRRTAAADRLGAHPGLEPTRTGDEAFDDRWETFSASGEAPTWLTPALRRALLSLDVPATATKDDRGFRVELPRRTQDPRLLARLVEIAAGARNPAAVTEEVATPFRARRSPYSTLARLQMVVLPLALIALHVALRPSAIGELRMGPPGAPVDISLPVRAGDVVEVWQDARFDADRHPRPELRLEIESSGRKLECNPHRVNNCSMAVTSGNTVRHGVDCYLEECESLRAARDGTLDLSIRLIGDDPATPYVSDHVLRFKRRSPLLSLREEFWLPQGEDPVAVAARWSSH